MSDNILPPLKESGELNKNNNFIQNNQYNILDIFVRTLTGRTIIINTNINETVISIKSQIEDIEGIPVCNQRIIFDGKHLEDNKKLSHYGIVKDSTLYVEINYLPNKMSTKTI